MNIEKYEYTPGPRSDIGIKVKAINSLHKISAIANKKLFWVYYI